MTPKISVVMSTFNRAKDFLPKAIDSVVKQQFEDWELIVVDDHSPDKTREVIKKYQDDKRVRALYLRENFGSDTRPKNLGTRMARADLIAYIDDDVQWRPNHLSLLYKNMTKDLDVVYSDMWIMPNDEPGIAFDFDAQFLMLRNFIDTSSALIRTQAVYDVGGWDENLPKFIDWNLWVRMAKAGKRFRRIPEITFDYYIHENTKSSKVKTETYMHPKLGRLFTPTFDPSGCKIHVGRLGEAHEPKVAIFTIHYNRPRYSVQTYEEMKTTSGYPFDWYAYNNGGTKKFGDGVWLGDGTNVGITNASNACIDAILPLDYDIIIKIDNDVEFDTRDWLADIVDLWQRNRMLYISPYVEGLLHNPGGSPRVGFGMIGSEYIEVTKHIGGIFACISADAYKEWRWSDTKLHGNQDLEASHAFRIRGYMPCYYPKHRIVHRDTTIGQQNKHIKYFEKRKSEKLSNALPKPPKAKKRATAKAGS